MQARQLEQGEANLGCKVFRLDAVVNGASLAGSARQRASLNYLGNKLIYSRVQTTGLPCAGRTANALRQALCSPTLARLKALCLTHRSSDLCHVQARLNTLQPRGMSDIEAGGQRRRRAPNADVLPDPYAEFLGFDSDSEGEWAVAEPQPGDNAQVCSHAGRIAIPPETLTCACGVCAEGPGTVFSGDEQASACLQGWSYSCARAGSFVCAI